MNNRTRRIMLLVVAIVTALTAAQGLSTVKAAPVTVTWFVGLGSGTNDQQIAAEKKVVSEFNAANPDVNLTIQIGANFQTSMDTITTLIASGNAPDIVGPVGVGGSNSLADQWMDLKPLMDKNKYDLSGFDPATVALYKTASSSGQTGYSAIPFAVYPSAMYYNVDLFKEAGLNPPPTKYGDMYTMPDKSQVPWNYDTVAKIGKLLTVDKAGNDATNAKFDPKNIVQYGLNFQYALMRLILTDLQPAAFYDAASNKVAIPDAWKQGITWLQAGLWKDHYISSATAEASTLGQPSMFDSGNLAMAIAPSWYTCCMQDKAGKLNWNLGVVPLSLDGKTHVAADADTFRVIKTTKNPDATFKALSYILDQAVPELSVTYGAFPARQKYQQGWIDAESKIYTQGVNWSVFTAGFPYVNPGNLHHESNLPHFQQVQDRFASFFTDLFGDSGATMNVDTAVAQLQTDLQSIVNGTFPTSTPIPTPTTAPTKAS